MFPEYLRNIFVQFPSNGVQRRHTFWSGFSVSPTQRHKEESKRGVLVVDDTTSHLGTQWKMMKICNTSGWVLVFGGSDLNFPLCTVCDFQSQGDTKLHVESKKLYHYSVSVKLVWKRNSQQFVWCPQLGLDKEIAFITWQREFQVCSK